MSYDDICSLSDELRLVLSLVFSLQFETMRGNRDVSAKATCQYVWNLNSTAASASAGVWDVTP